MISQWQCPLYRLLNPPIEASTSADGFSPVGDQPLVQAVDVLPLGIVESAAQWLQGR